MSQPLLTESSGKTTQRIARREPDPASTRSFQAGPNPLLQLQRTLGNYRVAQLIKAGRVTPEGRIIGGRIPGLQPKLTVGAADDQYEQEADRVARQVVTMPDPVATDSLQQAHQIEGEAGPAQSRILQSKPLPLVASITPFVQRQMGDEEQIEEEKDQEEDKEGLLQGKFLNKSAVLPLQRQRVIDEKDPESIQTKRLVQRGTLVEEDKDKIQTEQSTATITPVLQPQIENNEEPKGEEATVQANSPISLSYSFDAGEDVESRLNRSKGSGSPLPDAVRTYMEPRFGVDFGHVRVHTGGDSIQMNRDVGAQAFTHGSDIYYGAGHNPTNLELTAHELTHVVQQSGVQLQKTQPQAEEDADDQNERETNRVAHQVMSTMVSFVQRSWSSDRVDWVRTALHEDNWANSDPPGAYYVLNGLSIDDMVRLLRALTAAERKKLSVNLDEHATGFDRSRLHVGLINAAAPLADIAFQERSENLLWAIRSGNFATSPNGAFPLLVSAKGTLRSRLLAALDKNALNALIAHREEANAVPGAGDITTAIDWMGGQLFAGDVVTVGGRKFVIYDDEVRSGGSVSWIARNPGNIREGNRFGAIPGKKYHTSSVGDFAIFPDENTGMTGIISVLKGYGHVTVLQAMTKYAPPTDANNDPGRYARVVARKLGVETHVFIDVLSAEQLVIFAEEIKLVEGWIPGTSYRRDETTLPDEVRHRL